MNQSAEEEEEESDWILPVIDFRQSVVGCLSCVLLCNSSHGRLPLRSDGGFLCC